MNTILKSLTATLKRLRRPGAVALVILGALLFVTAVSADVPTRVPVRGTVPNPGTQQQELANITFPAPYNVFEFIVTCAACHGGQVDQQVAHFGNWSGSAMASAARDPVFRANQIIVNTAIKNATGEDGAGNMCMRCHSPNGWYSGRFDPNLNGAADGSSMLHSILLSTDDEGVVCEMCHRTMGAVEFKRTDLNSMDAVWNMMSGISDWPHSGGPYVDQDGDPTISEGNPYGDTALQIDEGMTYIGRYPGTADIYWKDNPLTGTYTGQTYGVYPPGWIDPFGNDVGGQPATDAAGNYLIQLDIPIGPPTNPNGTPNYNAQSVSPEHSTVKYPNTPPATGFIQTSEFCGACHELTVPVLNHGMPEQRTYTEWKYSAFSQGADAKTCQDCHMPRLSHEYSDEVTGSYNSDPFGEPGGWPYSKPRTNTAVHKLAGANRDLPMMMKALYPEVDMEAVGGGEGGGGVWVGTGNDTRIFPGMLSNRDPMWDRNQRNTEISLQDGVDVEIVSGPTWNDATQKWDVQVRVINNTGHRLPSGYPDGRRMWISLVVTDDTGALVYESGYYDEASATLFTDRNLMAQPVSRALAPLIDSDNNKVMIYERVTGTCQADNQGNLDACEPSLSLLNDFILFDNRIPPRGFTYVDYRTSGVKFWNYDPASFVPFEEYDAVAGQSTRYADGRNYDLVTYSFSAPATAALAVEADILFQSHTREFMEHLRANDNSTVRPQGPPRVWSTNYPLDPNYLSEEFGLAQVVQGMRDDGWLAPYETLRDNWGGIAYAAWYTTGKGAPYPIALASTSAASPDTPTGLQIFSVTNPDTNLNEAYTQGISWDPVANADGYLLWIKYGAGVTASWDQLAIVQAPETSLINTALNVNKTYCYKIQAFNGAGYSPESSTVCQKTPQDLPLPPENLQFQSSTETTITMTWLDISDNEIGWIVYRQDVPPDPLAGLIEIARFDSNTGLGGVQFTDGNGDPNVAWAAGYMTPQPGRCYNYAVEAYNAAGNSGWIAPVQMCTGSVPGAPTDLTAAVGIATRVNLTWTAATGTVSGYRIERSSNGGLTWPTVFDLPDPLAVGFTDTTSLAARTYQYRVFAYNTSGDSLPSNVASVTTPAAPPAAPTNLRATIVLGSQVNLAWNDNATNENGYRIERSDDAGLTWAQIAQIGANRTTYNDTTVEPKITYLYRVYAFRTLNRGISDFSNVITVVTPAEIPQPPTSLRLVSRTNSSITVRWRDNSTNETGFRLEWSTDNINWNVIDMPANTTTTVTYAVTGLQANTTYAFRVLAYNLDGQSAYSNSLIAATRR